jgi:hypothetical protein
MLRDLDCILEVCKLLQVTLPYFSLQPRHPRFVCELHLAGMNLLFTPFFLFDPAQFNRLLLCE